MNHTQFDGEIIASSSAAEEVSGMKLDVKSKKTQDMSPYTLHEQQEDTTT